MAEVYQPIMGTNDGEGHMEEGSDEALSEYRSDPSVSVEYDEEFENLVNTLMHDRDYISVNQAALNIAYTIINAGLIAIPFTAYNAGIPLFIAVVVVMAIISNYVAVMVISMANQKRVRTLEDLAEVCGGPKFFLCVCAFQILFSFSMMCVTLNVWSDVMSDVFSSTSLSGVARHVLATRRGEVLVGAVIVLPLCVFKRSMISLRWTAYLTVCAVAFCLCAVVVAFFAHKEGPSLDRSATDLVTPQSEWWTVLLVVVFCFSYNQRVFAVYRCMKRRNTERWTQAVRKASCSVTVLYLLFGVAGYLTLARNDIKADNFNYFLDNHGENNVIFNIARVVVVSSLLLTIPVDSLIASSTWRRLHNRYLRMVSPKYHHPSNTSGSSHSARYKLISERAAQRDGLVSAAAAGSGPSPSPSRTKLTEEEEAHADRSFLSEDTASAALPASSASVGGEQASHRSSTATANEYGQFLVLSSAQEPPAIMSHAKSAPVPVPAATVPSEHPPASDARGTPCSPPHVTLSHLNMLMNDAAPVRGLRQNSSSGSLGANGVNTLSPMGALENMPTDRRSFTSTGTGYSTGTGTGTGRASSVTGSGVAGNRMISKDEMESILRVNSFSETKSRPSARSQHEQDAEYDAEQEGGGLDTSWSYDAGRALSGFPGRGKGGFVAEVWRGRLVPLVLWGLCALVCIGVDHWMYIAATVGTLSTTMLLFIFPTMFYFRMSLASDYSATPLCGRLVPNALYMGLIQVLGIVILLGDIVAMIYMPLTGAHIIQNET